MDDIPAGIVALADYERLARERLDPAAAAWLDGGAGDETTLQANRAAWSALRLWPRVLQPLADAHTRVELLGATLAHPLIVAPMAFQRLLHPQGELALALAAAAQRAGFVLSGQASVAMEEVTALVGREPGRGPLWFQLYLPRDRGAAAVLLERAERAGFEALVLTVDAPVQGPRDRERRAGFRLPAGLAAPNLPPPPATLGDGSCAGLLQHAIDWSDLDWLRGRTRLPLLLKGVLHPDDARQARALGVDALVVSNHGGRTLDAAVETAWALPRVADALHGELPLLVDGGVRRGSDVVKALALGARAVMVGRPMAHALAVAGARGVAHALRLLRDECEGALALAGCASPAQASRALVVAR